MKRALLLAMLGALSIHTFVEAQQGGVNTSVLPPRFNPPPATITPDEFVRTDAIGQKQVEARIAASTRNWDVLFAVFNDYRWVQAGDFLTGETINPSGVMSNLLAWLFHRPRKPAVRSVSAAAPAEAWIGGATSNDGGATWSGVVVPGGPFDNSPASLASPVKSFNFQAATDPHIIGTPCGFFHIIYVPFTRNQDSAVAVSTYRHLNDADGRRTIRHLYTSIVQYVHNATNGPFLDLPYLAADPIRTPGANPCDYNLYAAYMAFNGADNSTKPTFVRSTDGGKTWSKTTISATSKTNQRAVLAVDPLDGAVYLGWRSFDNGAASPSAMWITRSTDFGVSFPKAVQMNGTPLQTFDQRAQSVDDCAAVPECLAFRSNAYMSLRVVPDPKLPNPSTLVAAWVERVSLQGCAALPSPVDPCGRPDGIGQEPRVVMMKASTANWMTWTDLAGNVGQRRAIDFGDRDDVQSAPAPGQGYLPQPRPSGAQFQPDVVAVGDDIGIVYYEARGPLTQFTGVPPYIGGLHRQVEARFALLDRVTGGLRGTSQISKYEISATADLSNGEDTSDIAEVAAGTGERAVNTKVNAPNAGAGKIPFIGDYTAAIATVDWVLDAGRWRAAYKTSDLPFPGYRAVFADSRNVIPPPGTDAQQIAAYPNFTPVGLPNCANPGSRNHDVEHVLINSSVILDVPTTFKFLGVIQRAFPFTLINGLATKQFFRVDLIPDDGVQVSFAQGTSATTLTDIQTRLYAELLPYSSTTRAVYMASQIPTGSTRINVYKVSAIGDTGGTLVGSSRLNLDPTNTSTLSATSETHTVTVSPLVTSPLVTSPLVTSAGAGSTMVANPLVTSPLVTSPLVTSSAYQDFTWSVSGGSDMVNSAMVAQVFVDKANSQQTSKSYKFELRIHKRSAHLGINGCTSGPAADEQLISSVFIDTAAVNTDDPTATPLVTSPLVTSPLVTSPLVTSPLVTSSTFSMSPPDTTSTSGGTTASFTAEAAATSDDGTLQDKLDNRVFITLRAYLNKSIDPTKAPKLPTPKIRVEPLSRDVIPDPNNPGQFILR